jgi:hypothetical protein
MTANEFRRMALALPETVEAAHMDHPDFRVRGKIFATLAYPDTTWGTVMVTPAQQARLVKAEPAMFVPVKGTWGERGATHVKLRAARKAPLHGALVAAWYAKAPKSLAKQHDLPLSGPLGSPA